MGHRQTCRCLCELVIWAMCAARSSVSMILSLLEKNHGNTLEWDFTSIRRNN